MPSQPSAVPAETSGNSSPYLRDSALFHWAELSLYTDWVFTLAIAICLGGGLVSGHPAAGMIAAGGAMTVGLGAKQPIDDSRLLPMIFVSFGMAFSTFIGMVVGHENFVLVPLAALWGFGYGMLSDRPAGYGWVAQQCVVTLLVASAFPFSPKAAAIRASLILVGGAAQIFIISILFRLLKELSKDLIALARYTRAEQMLLRAAIAKATQTIRKGEIGQSAVPYSIRLAVTLGAGTALYTHLHFASGYWIPMTALLVLKPGLSDTASRAIARTVGTIAGAILASFMIAYLAPAPLALAAFTLLFAWLAYGTLNVNYALFSVSITAYIVFLLSLASIPGNVIAVRRTIFTTIGGGLALTVRLMVLHRRRRFQAAHDSAQDLRENQS
jgi:uncharacterized membrane protein YccC